MIIIIFIIFAIIDYFLIRFEIKKNISLFYACHKKQVDKIIEDKKEDDLIEKI